jgi:hypothetical protein
MTTSSRGRRREAYRIPQSSGYRPNSHARSFQPSASIVAGVREIPVLPNADDAQDEADRATSGGRRAIAYPASAANDENDSAGQRRGRIYIGAEHSRNLREQHVADGPASNP